MLSVEPEAGALIDFLLYRVEETYELAEYICIYVFQTRLVHII